MADRFFGGYFLCALLRQQGIDFVIRLHQCRKIPDMEGPGARKMPNGDWVVEWNRPQRPKWMDEETYAALPPTLTLRWVKVCVNSRSSRTSSFYVVTSLMDSECFSSESIAELYLARWNIELDFNTIKTTMGLDFLRAKSPELARTEFLMGLLAYNLIRAKILQAGRAQHAELRKISFSAGLRHFVMTLTLAAFLPRTVWRYIDQSLLRQLPIYRVGNRPGRTEPRKVKRRQKPHDLLTEPRSSARLKL